MAEVIQTIQKSKQGEGSFQNTETKAKDSQTRTQTPGKTTRTRQPVKTESHKPGYETVSTSEPSESVQVATEDIGLEVTWKIRITSWGGPSC